MARTHEFPKVDDLSPNKPNVSIDHDKILALYNKSEGENMQRVTKKVRSWLEDEAVGRQGYDSVKFDTKGAMLSIESERRGPPIYN